MNNVEGVYSGPYDCEQTIETILPTGSSMPIWYLGAASPEIIYRTAG